MRRVLAAVTLGLVFAFPTVVRADDGGSADGGIPDVGVTSVDFPGEGCPAGAIGCARAPIAYDHRVALPIEFSVDTGWVPSGSPIQVRFESALIGHTEVSAAGVLQAAWPAPMQLTASGTPGSGTFASDWGVLLDALVRLHLDLGAGTVFDWEGSIPYIPMINVVASANTTFDPWAWGPVSITGSTMRQHVADIPLTDLIVSIPGVSGGLSFDVQVDLTTTYHSTSISFGPDADPITAATSQVTGLFTSGLFVDYAPQLNGHVDWTPTVHVYPALYVSLLGARWSVDLFDLPVTLPDIGADWAFDPSPAHLLLPDVGPATDATVDFGDVLVGTTVRSGAFFDSDGEVPLWVIAPTTSASPFGFLRENLHILPHTREAYPITFACTSAGPVSTRVAFQTDDPDTPTVYVTLRANGFVIPEDAGSADMGVPDGGSEIPPDVIVPTLDAGSGASRGSCGCRIVGTQPGLGRFWVYALGGACALRRRRRRA